LPLLFLIAWGVFFAAGEYLVHADPLERTGTVVLLSGGGDERMLTAARLMKERYAELLILTDTGNRLADGTAVTEYMKLEAIADGVSPAQIQFTDHVAGSTRDEAHAVRLYMQLHQITGCIVVTDPYHTRRTRMIFQNEMRGTGIDVRVMPSDGHWYQAGRWFTSLRGWQATVSEYGKLGYFLLWRELN
jgi:uncharacterized SAM-binding protein YcdF (DUF218 family)